ncbi:MAG: polysaccharide deacetylase family protein [Oscillospiraceae bacterium]|nr:polysaccharide deacetylase family protein [Oscillospiraceae bacterium]
MGKYESRSYAKRRAPRWVLPLVIVLVLALAAGGMYYVWEKNEFSLVMTLNGESEITLEYGEKYVEQGAYARFSGTMLLRQPRDITVTTTGAVDDQTLGTYQVTYRSDMELDLWVTKLPFSATQTRTVHIVDTCPPEITLTQLEGHYTLPGHEYQEEGFAAVDNYDGDLTEVVERIVGDGVVVYAATDSSGNRSEKIRDIYYFDPEAPQLTMLGVEHITVGQGAGYLDPGCTATDNGDGDITSRITVSGQVDTDVPGTYTLEYSVADTYGNKTTATRQITVKKISHANVTKPEVNENKIIYLTFDDGPGPHTEKLLDLLDKYDIKATFFVIHSEDYMHLLPRMAASGHTVAMHCYEHTYSKIYRSTEAYFEDLNKIRQEIYDYTGQTADLLRFPGGASNTVSRRLCPGIMTVLARQVQEQGMQYSDWNVDSNDAGGATTSDEVLGNVTGGIRSFKKSIVLQHDIKLFSVNAVEDIILWGLKNGYTFRAMTADGPVHQQRINN